jgi:HK97 family phage major capsid protein
MLVSQKLKDWLTENGYGQKSWTEDSVESATNSALSDGKLTVQKLAELIDAEVSLTPRGKSPSAKDVFGNLRVKRPSERYSHTKSVAKHARTGLPVCNERGREVETISQREYAKAGAFLKRVAQRSGLPVELSEHEGELLAECFDDVWCGKIGGNYETEVPGSRVKTLLNDGTSGGQELVPIFYDEMVIQYPLLYSELLPKVDLVNVPRGSTIDSAAVGNPTVTWAASESTAITAFSTTSLVSAVDTTIRPVTCAVEIGRDFMSDAAVDVGRVLTENVGQSLLSELDRVIASGNGSTEPVGIYGTSGLTDIGNPTGGNGAPPQVDDYERLLFAVGKQYRNPSMRCSFIGNDVSYRRARGIPVGQADARRVFGMDHQSYMLLDYPFAVNNSISNAIAIFGALSKYRLYRRQAQEIRFETAGKTLGLANTVLLIVRGRFGGRVVDANAFAFSSHWQA